MSNQANNVNTNQTNGGNNQPKIWETVINTLEPCLCVYDVSTNLIENYVDKICQHAKIDVANVKASVKRSGNNSNIEVGCYLFFSPVSNSLSGTKAGQGVSNIITQKIGNAVRPSSDLIRVLGQFVHGDAKNVHFKKVRVGRDIYYVVALDIFKVCQGLLNAKPNKYEVAIISATAETGKFRVAKQVLSGGRQGRDPFKDIVNTL